MAQSGSLGDCRFCDLLGTRDVDSFRRRFPGKNSPRAPEPFTGAIERGPAGRSLQRYKCWGGGLSPNPKTLDGCRHSTPRAGLSCLWRFHLVHHDDPALDVTSATRFHFGEILISSVLRVALIPLFGLGFEYMLVYDLFQLPIIQLHHSNVRLPAGWDRMMSTLRLRQGPAGISYGLSQFDEPSRQTVVGMLRAPFSTSLHERSS